MWLAEKKTAGGILTNDEHASDCLTEQICGILDNFVCILYFSDEPFQKLHIQSLITMAICSVHCHNIVTNTFIEIGFVAVLHLLDYSPCFKHTAVAKHFSYAQVFQCQNLVATSFGVSFHRQNVSTVLSNQTFPFCLHF